MGERLGELKEQTRSAEAELEKEVEFLDIKLGVYKLRLKQLKQLRMPAQTFERRS